MSVEKGPKTGPAEFAGVDISNPTTGRNDSVSDTITPGEEDFNMPDVDLQHASTLRPSRVSGNRLLWYITFVCGTGVSQFLTCGGHSLISVYLFWIRSRCIVVFVDSTFVHRDFPRDC